MAAGRLRSSRPPQLFVSRWRWMGLGWVEVKEGVNCNGAAVHDLALGIHSRPVQPPCNGMESTAGTEVRVVVSCIMISRAEKMWNEVERSGTNVNQSTFRGSGHVIKLKPTLTPDMFVVFWGRRR
jgi:hypothetical protein